MTTLIDISKYLLRPSNSFGHWWYVDPTKEKELRAFLVLAGIKKPLERIWNTAGKPVVLKSLLEKELNDLL